MPDQESEEETKEEISLSPETLNGIRITNRTISHFLRNSLNPISGGAEMLLEDSTLSDDQKKLVNGIADAAKQLKDRMDRLQNAVREGDIKLVNGPAGVFIDLNEPKQEK